MRGFRDQTGDRISALAMLDLQMALLARKCGRTMGKLKKFKVVAKYNQEEEGETEIWHWNISGCIDGLIFRKKRLPVCG